MIVKHFGCTTIHNKALYKCIIHSFIHSNNFPRKNTEKHNYICKNIWPQNVTFDQSESSIAESHIWCPSAESKSLWVSLNLKQQDAVIQVRVELVERADQRVIHTWIQHIWSGCFSASVAGRPPGLLALLQAHTEENRYCKAPQRWWCLLSESKNRVPVCEKVLQRPQSALED